jgi:tetratricopeptide (TPR) repeat protein
MKRSKTMRCSLVAVFLAVLVLAWSGAALAQTSGRISGQVFDLQGNPYPNVSVTMTDKDTGQVFTAKTEKDGKFAQLGLKGGVYSLNFKDPAANPPLDYTMPFQVTTDQDNPVTVNFKDIAADYAKAHPADKDASTGQFQNMKQHFQAGLDAMQTYNQDHAQAAKAAAADRAALAAKAKTDCQTAATEFDAAAKAVGAKDTKNPPVILGNLGAAYECADRYSDAADTYQKAIALKPDAGFYSSLATNQVKAATAQPGATDAQMDDVLAKAGVNCDQAATLDPTRTAPCWRNLGIVFSNSAHMKQASVALKKATAADPTNAEAWYMLGSALLNLMDSKQEKDKIVYIIQPGTAEAYQKYLELAPNGPYAQPSKDALATIESLQGGESTTIKNKKKG